MSQNSYECYSSTYIVRRLKKDDEDVFFIGESPTCALPLALAAMRGSLDRVWAAGFESHFIYNNRHAVFKDWYDPVLRNAEVGDWTDKTVRRVQRQIQSFEDSDLTIERLKRHFSSSSSVDARRLKWTRSGRTRMIPSRNIFWMCPWCRDNTQLGDLLCSFIRAAAALQGEGDMLLLGLAVGHPKWGPKYRLERVEAAAREYGYLALPRDRRFVKKALRYGYVHHTLAPGADDSRLHGDLFRKLEVHPFLKQTKPTPVSRRRAHAGSKHAAHASDAEESFMSAFAALNL